MGQILLLRHGQASLLSDDYDQLSPLGVQQARRAGEALAQTGAPARLVVSGTLNRQADTARHMMAAAGWQSAYRQDPRFDEYDHADLFGGIYPDLDTHAKTAAYVAAQDNPRAAFQSLFEQAFAAWMEGRTGASGLTWPAFRARAVAALGDVAESLGSGERAVIATSGGVIAALVQELIGLPDAQVLNLHNPVQNASLTRILTKGRAMSLGGFNDVSHLAPPFATGLVTYR